MQATSPKTRYQNDVTKILHFQAPSLSKTLVALLLSRISKVLIATSSNYFRYLRFCDSNCM